jgi:D-glycero-D-manno-heptose 1,7-bisphosphate phosphatase
MENRRRAVFLDRDGVLNEVVLRGGKPYPPASLSELRLSSKVEECLADLKRLGFLLIVVTNQPDVARGTQSTEAVEEMHGFLISRLPIDDVCVCFHDDANGCNCRKPKPGLVLQAVEKHDIELRQSFLIGDRWRDIEAGHRAHCRTVFINYGYAEKGPEVTATFETNSLRNAVDWILAHAQSEG